MAFAYLKYTLFAAQARKNGNELAAMRLAIAIFFKAAIAVPKGGAE